MTTLIPSLKLRRNFTILNRAISNRNTETDTMQNPRMNARTNSSPKILRGLAASASALALAGLLAGCGGALLNTGGTDGSGGGVTVHFQGNVHGGQAPVTGAFLQLYSVGTGGPQSAATPLITPGSVTSDSNGNFTLTGTYSCTSATQVYLVATQGNPGSVANPNLSMMAALGDCATLKANAATTFIQMNELTTVAAAYALAPFAKDYADIGATGSNPTGLLNAFANANMLVSTTSGAAPGTVPAGATVPVTELNTLANIIASCVNTAGSTSTQCMQLFSATGASDTFAAALAIAKNPGAAAITGLYTLSNAQAPFQLSMTAQPNDFTVAVNFNPSGTFATPYCVALDAAGDAWVTNEGGSTVTELSPNGTVLATPTAPGLVGPQGVAVDKLGNVWVANTAGNSVVKFTLTGGAVSATNSYTNGGITAPIGIAIDSANTVWVANYNSTSVSALSNGLPISGSPFQGDGHITVPTWIGIGPGDGAVYVTSGNGTVEKLSNSGAFTSVLSDNTLQGPISLALGSAGQLAVTGFTTGSTINGALGEFTSSGSTSTPASVSPVTAGLSRPVGIASDFTSFWVANNAVTGSLAQFVFGSATPASPAMGFGALNAPVGVAVDSSGSIWTANSGDNSVSKFIGLASPVATPMAVNVGP
jgi:streptogramin lyase